MKKLFLSILVLGLLWCNISLSLSTTPFSDAVGGKEWVKGCEKMYYSQFESKKITKEYCKCSLDYLDKNITQKEMNEVTSEKEANELLAQVGKKGRNYCVTKVTKIKTDSKKLKDSVLTKEKIILEYKSTLPICEGGEADMGKDILRWTKWNNCLGTLKLIDESGEELTFVSEFKNGEMMGKFTFTSNSEVLFAERKKSGCKKNGYQIVDGSLAKVKLNKNCDITKITYLD